METVAFVLAIILVALLGAGVRTAWRLKAFLTRDSATDDRPPVLYLRSFLDDVVKLRPGAPDFDSEEQQLVSMLRAVGPVLTLRSPHVFLPELGAKRVDSTNDWQTTVIDLLARSQLVVIRIAATQNLLWEITEVQRLVTPDNVVLYLGKAKRDERWRAFRDQTRGVFPHALPESIGDAVILCFLEGWTWELRGSTRRNLQVPLSKVPGGRPILALLWTFVLLIAGGIVTAKIALVNLGVALMLLVFLGAGPRLLRATREGYAHELGLVRPNSLHRVPISRTSLGSR